MRQLSSKLKRNLLKSTRRGKKFWLRSSTRCQSCEKSWPTWFTTRWIWWERNRQGATKTLKMLKKRKSPNNRPKLQSTIQRTCPSDGMASPFLTGCTSCMGWESSTNARSAATTLTGVGGPFKCTSRNGDIVTAWDASKYPILYTSRTLQPSATRLPSMKSWREKVRTPNSGQTWKRSFKTTRETFSTEGPTSTWRSKVCCDSAKPAGHFISLYFFRDCFDRWSLTSRG